MATRPAPRSRDGARPRSMGGRPPSSPRSSDSPNNSTRVSVSASSAPDKPMPSFLRPTVSSSLHSSSSSSSTPITLKGPATAATAALKRPADRSPAVALRPITPKDKAKAAAATSRWSAVSPRQLMQRASNAIKSSKTSRAKKGKDVAAPGTSPSGKDGTGASVEAKTETSNPVEPPPAVQPDEFAAVVVPAAEKNEQPEATPQEVVSTHTMALDGSTEELSYDALKNEAIEEKVILVESEEALELELEEKAQTGVVVAETETEAQKDAEDHLSPAGVVDEAAKETPEIMENFETSMIPEEQDAQLEPTEKQEEVTEEANVAAESSAPSEPATPLKEALDGAEPVTAAREATHVDKAVVETAPSASEPTTPAKSADKKEATAIAPEGAGLTTFKGSKVKTAMEKRSDEEQPKKKEVARSNDVIEEAKSKLLEKRKSKVKALVGAFETVMDAPNPGPSPGKST